MQIDEIGIDVFGGKSQIMSNSVKQQKISILFAFDRCFPIELYGVKTEKKKERETERDSRGKGKQSNKHRINEYENSCSIRFN